MIRDMEIHTKNIHYNQKKVHIIINRNHDSMKTKKNIPKSCWFLVKETVLANPWTRSINSILGYWKRVWYWFVTKLNKYPFEDQKDSEVLIFGLWSCVVFLRKIRLSSFFFIFYFYFLLFVCSMREGSLETWNKEIWVCNCIKVFIILNILCSKVTNFGHWFLSYVMVSVTWRVWEREGSDFWFQPIGMENWLGHAIGIKDY